MRPGLLLLLAAALAAGVACKAPLKQVPPEGFAAYPDRVGVRAVSPDNVVYRTRTVPNEPAKGLSFWKEALKHRMLEAGYRLLGESDLSVKNRNGWLIELAAPLGNADYEYLIAIFPTGDKEILIVEAAGEVLKLKARREAILGAIDNLKWKSPEASGNSTP